MKKNITVITIAVILLFFALFIVTRYHSVRTVDINAYVITSDRMLKNLKNNDSEKKDVDYTQVEATDYIYKNSLAYFVGEETKTRVNLDFPIISRDSDELLVMSEEAKYIDEFYYKTEAYQNSYFANGYLYNGNTFDRVDNSRYLFVELKNGLFTSLTPIKYKETVIPSNSVIHFEKDGIRYYSIENEKFMFREITGIDKSDVFVIYEKEIKFEDLLDKLDLDLLRDKEKNDNNNSGYNGYDEEETETKIIEEEKIYDEIVGEPEENTSKPVVSFEMQEPTAYLFKGNLKIKDVDGRISKGITFEFRQNGKIFLRKVFYNPGYVEVEGLLPNNTYDVTAYFIYTNERNREVKKTFFNDSVTMKNIESDSVVNFAYSNIEVTSNSFIINDFSLSNDAEDEVLKGIKKIAFVYNGKEYLLSSDLIFNLRNKEEVVYRGITVLNSNTDYDVLIKAYDIADNELHTTNNTFSIHTAKEKPFAITKISSVGVDRVQIGISYQNKDNISILNQKYVIYDNNNVMLFDGDIDNSGVFEVKGLDTNKVYYIEIFGDYDLEDGKGIVHEALLGSTNFITNSLSSLGYARLNLTEVEKTFESITYDIALDSAVTNSQLKEIITNFQIQIIDDDTKRVAYEKIISGDEMNDLKNDLEVQLNVLGLYSNTIYDINVITNINLANSSYQIPTITNYEKFKTYKKHAKVDIINRYVNDNTIDFDVKISDIDHSILSNNVFMEVRNAFGGLIYFDYLDINSDYKRVMLNKLDKDEQYTFKYTVEEYNIGDTNETFENWRVLFEETIETKKGIIGKIELESLLEQISNTNLFNVANESRWKSDGSGVSYYHSDLLENIVSLGAKNGPRTFSYYLPENVGDTVTVSFQAKYGNSNHQDVSIINGEKSNSSGSNVFLLEDLSDTYKYYTYTFTLSSPYVSFNVNEILRENNVTYLELKNMQIEVGSTATSYKPYVSKAKMKATYVVDIEDLRGEIADGKFYVRMIRVDEEEALKSFDLTDPNGVSNFISSYDVSPNTTYSFKLSVKINNRYYDLDSLDFDTNTEIRTIKTVNDFKNIHESGNYLVVRDLDFTNKYFTPLYFNGKIDFQGHKIYRNTKSASNVLFYSLGSTAILKNMDIHYYLDHESVRSSFSGIAYQNDGVMQNIKITIEETNGIPLYGSSFLTHFNNGTIENFVVHTKVSVPFIYDAGLVLLNNRGNILNGYLYGEPIDATTNIDDENLTNKKIGVIDSQACCGAAIKNVYSLIGIDVAANAPEKDRLVGGISGASGDQLRNIYFYAGGKNRVTSYEPASSNPEASFIGSNVYYFGDEIYENATLSQKISKMALYEPFFQNSVLNSTYMFNVDELLRYGYYPHIIWPECMPNQEYVPLPTVDNEDLIDIIAVSDVQYEGTKAIIKMIVNNPNLERVTDIGIYLIDGVSIVSQEDFKGRSHLTVELSNPLRYASSYYIKSITAMGAGGSFTVEYEDGERVINVDMYRPIYNVYDYMEITEHPSENFILMNDLDLSQVPDPQLGTFTGKFNGNNHYIRNIYITSDGKNSFIHELIGGTIINLYIENYMRDNLNGFENSGVIGKAENAIIDNVHVKNVKTVALKRTGGLAGTVRNSVVSNCSVSGFSVVKTDTDKTDDIFVGGLIGSLVSTDVSNCFAIDIDIDVSKTRFTYALGGLIGNNDSGKLYSVYAEGRIRTTHQNVGGLVGNNDNGSVDSAYSKVDIISNQDYIGGLTGTGTNITHAIYLGDLYSSTEYDIAGMTTHINRISGSARANNELYAWEGQYINGKVSGANNGESLLTTEDLKLHLVYETIIKMSDEFDFSQVDDGILPKLYNSTTKELLPNQVDIEFEKKGLRINDLRIIKSSERIEQLTVVLYNPDHYNISGIDIEDMRVNEIQSIYSDGDYTDITLVATPQKYYDSYPITGIRYINNNGYEKTVSVYSKIDAIFYKSISSAYDWNNKIDPTSYENYVLTNDIDFTNEPITNVSIKVNRMIGLGDGKKIKGINYTYRYGGNGIIDVLVKEFANIQVDNLTLKTTNNRKYFGFIKYFNGIIHNVKFTNSTITATSASDVGFIAYSKIEDFRDIYMENVTVSSKNNVGGFIGSIAKVCDGNYVTLRNIKIYGQGKIGSFCGNCIGSSATWFHFDANDIEVTSSGTSGYVGGLFGNSASAKEVVANNIRVTGSGDYIGGVFGRGYAFSSVKLTNSHVTASTGKNVGMISGAMSSGLNLLSESNILDAGNATCAGGIIGYSPWGLSTNNLSVINSQINSSANDVGGIFGCAGNNLTVKVINIENTSITGNDYVGGLIGKKNDTGKVSITTFAINATITGNDYVGGLVGYYSNKNSTDSVADRKATGGMILSSTITGNKYVGGLFGRVDKLIYPGTNSNIYVDADVIGNQLVGAVIGSGDSYANYNINGYGINGLRIYGNSNIQIGSNTYKVSDNQTGLTASTILTINDLRQQSTYTNIGLSTTNYEFAELSNDKYPRIKHSLYNSDIYDEDFPHYIAFTSKEVLSGASVSRSKFVRVPNVIAYTSDVDKINIEFSNVSEGTTFTIFGKSYQLTQRAYTFIYDFATDFDVVVSAGVNSKTYSFKADDIRKNVYLNDSNYYVVEDGTIDTDNNSLSKMANTGINYQVLRLSGMSEIADKVNNVLNIYNEKVLLDGNRIYDLNSKSIKSNSGEVFSLVETVPLYTFTYANSKIETYYNFSIVDDIVLPKQIFVKNDMMEIIDSSLNSKKNEIVIDEYNGKSSIVYLGNDKKIHNIKSPIKYPDNFINKNIKEISSNVIYNTTAILVLYENGNYVLFDYKTGEIIKENKNYKESIYDYMKSYMNGEYEKGIKKDEKYDEANKLINRLYEKSNINTLYSLGKNSSSYYTSVYNPVKEKYDIIEIPLKDSGESLNQLLSNDTVNGKIDNNIVLSAYYNTKYRKISLGIFVIVSVVIALILSLLFTLRISMKSKRYIKK